MNSMNMPPFTYGTCWKAKKNLYVEQPVSIADTLSPITIKV